MPVTDRAAVVAEALVSEIVDVLTTTTVARTELRRPLRKSCATSLRRSAGKASSIARYPIRKASKLK